MKKLLFAVLMLCSMCTWASGTDQFSDELLQQEYAKLKAKLGDKEYSVRHIMVESEAEAREIITQLGGKKPKKFETLAARSKDTGTVASGGALGWVHLGELEQPFPIVLVTLKKGEYTKTPVKSHFGWHVIKLDDIRESKVPSFEDVKPQLQQRLKQRATNLATFGQDYEGNVSDGKKMDGVFLHGQMVLVTKGNSMIINTMERGF